MKWTHDKDTQQPWLRLTGNKIPLQDNLPLTWLQNFQKKSVNFNEITARHLNPHLWPIANLRHYITELLLLRHCFCRLSPPLAPALISPAASPVFILRQLMLSRKHLGAESRRWCKSALWRDKLEILNEKLIDFYQSSCTMPLQASRYCGFTHCFTHMFFSIGQKHRLYSDKQVCGGFSFLRRFRKRINANESGCVRTPAAWVLIFRPI